MLWKNKVEIKIKIFSDEASSPSNPESAETTDRQAWAPILPLLKYLHQVHGFLEALLQDVH